MKNRSWTSSEFPPVSLRAFPPPPCEGGVRGGGPGGTGAGFAASGRLDRRKYGVFRGSWLCPVHPPCPGVVKGGRFELKLGFPETPIFGALLAMDRKEPTQEPGHGSCIRSRMDRPIVLSELRCESSPSIFSQVESVGKPSTWRSRNRPSACGQNRATSFVRESTGSRRLRPWPRNWLKSDVRIGRNMQWFNRPRQLLTSPRAELRWPLPGTELAVRSSPGTELAVRSSPGTSSSLLLTGDRTRGLLLTGDRGSSLLLTWDGARGLLSLPR